MIFNAVLISIYQSSFAQPLTTSTTIQETTKQLIVVVSKDWDSRSGIMYTYTHKDDTYTDALKPIPIILGRNGMAWGIGLHTEYNNPKKEGDGRSPAGRFSLLHAFGYGTSPKIQWPYTQVDSSWYCVDDSNDENYNSVLQWTKDMGVIPWKSAEKMRRSDAQYKLGLIIDHNQTNTQNAQKKAGSCIFFHIWKSAKGKTAGCTAMSEDSMTKLLKWLDPNLSPELVQLPIDEYEKRKESWNLPQLKSPFPHYK